MSANTFPSLIGQNINVERTEEFRTDVYETVSGKEQRTSWWDTPRYSYSVKMDVLRDNVSAPAPYAAYSEVATVLFFLETHLGSYDSFSFVDPLDGTTRTVRFVEDSLTIQKIADHHWTCDFKLISVK